MTPKQLSRALVQIVREGITETDMRKFGNIVMMERKKHFEAGQGPDGNTWKKLSPKTIKRKGHSKPLIDKGYLRDMYISTVTKAGVVLRVAKSRAASVWSGLSISEIHDHGTDEIPARPHMGIPKAAEDKIKREAARLIERALKKYIRR
jgi:phage gpG-like protein